MSNFGEKARFEFDSLIVHTWTDKKNVEEVCIQSLSYCYHIYLRRNGLWYSYWNDAKGWCLTPSIYASKFEAESRINSLFVKNSSTDIAPSSISPDDAKENYEQQPDCTKAEVEMPPVKPLKREEPETYTWTIHTWIGKENTEKVCIQKYNNDYSIYLMYNGYWYRFWNEEVGWCSVPTIYKSKKEAVDRINVLFVKNLLPNIGPSSVVLEKKEKKEPWLKKVLSDAKESYNQLPDWAKETKNSSDSISLTGSNKYTFDSLYYQINNLKRQNSETEAKYQTLLKCVEKMTKRYEELENLKYSGAEIVNHCRSHGIDVYIRCFVEIPYQQGVNVSGKLGDIKILS